jgi:acetyl-CoA C-acetyltransferase
MANSNPQGYSQSDPQSEVFVLGAARTPIGSFQGALASLTAPELGAHAINAALGHAGLVGGQINEVIFGNVLSAGLKQAPARQAMRIAGLPDATGATTINKVCGSGMKATMLAIDLIRAGSADYVISGGMESMTNAPYLMAKARAGVRMGHTELKDSMFFDGLEDAETGRSMGTFAQDTADQFQLTREDMDAFAIESVNRARNAIAEGMLRDEIAPIPGTQRHRRGHAARRDCTHRNTRCQNRRRRAARTRQTRTNPHVTGGVQRRRQHHCRQLEFDLRWRVCPGDRWSRGQ